jgi:hypothetical protein
MNFSIHLTMMKFFYSCFLLLVPYVITGQPVTEVTDLTEQKLEETGATGDDTPDLSEIDERLRTLMEHPLNLNRSDEAAIRESGLFNPQQVTGILRHRELFGPLVSIHELQVIPGFDPDFIRSVMPFVTTGTSLDAPNANWGRMIREGTQYVLLRTQLVPETKTGYLTYYGPPAYEGSPVGLLVRYRFRFMNKLSWGITAEKDPGESLFRGHQKNGFDFYSYHLAMRDAGPFRMVALGDYQLDYGQGLTLSTGMSGGKPADPLQIRRNPSGIMPYTSTNEVFFKRGAAVSLGSRRWSIDLFASHRKLDGNLYGAQDSVAGNEYVSSIAETGYHRTWGEIIDRHALTERMGGGHLRFRGRQFQAGFTGYALRLSLPLMKNHYLYNRFEFRGTNTLNTGIDYGWLFRNLNFFGEVSRSGNGAVAFVQGLVAGLDPKLAVSLAYRSYPRNYHNLYSGAIRESGNNFNESGILAGCVLRPLRTLQIQCLYDWFRYPWLRYQVDAPSSGAEFSGTITWNPSRKTTLYIRYRDSRKQANAPDEGDLLTGLAQVRQRGIRFHISSKITKSFTVRTRVEYVNYEFPGDRQQGMVIFQDLLYHPMGSRLTGNIRYGLFDTDSYDSRVYAYENDVLGGYSIPAYYYRGTRINFNFRYKLADGVDFWFRYSASFYDNRDTVGSGYDEIEGSKKSEFKWQMRFEF